MWHSKLFISGGVREERNRIYRKIFVSPVNLNLGYTGHSCLAHTALMYSPHISKASFTYNTHTIGFCTLLHSLSLSVLIMKGMENSPCPALVFPATEMLYSVNGTRPVSRCEVSLLKSSAVSISLPDCLMTV